MNPKHINNFLSVNNPNPELQKRAIDEVRDNPHLFASLLDFNRDRNPNAINPMKQQMGRIQLSHYSPAPNYGIMQQVQQPGGMANRFSPMTLTSQGRLFNINTIVITLY